MSSGKQLHIKWILWGLFIALNVIPLFYPNESMMWTLRSIGYEIEGLDIQGISNLKIGRFVDDTKERHLELKNLSLKLSRSDIGFAVDLSIDQLSYKDRHLPNYKLKNLLQGLLAVNTLAVRPGLSIPSLNIQHLNIEFSESSASFKIDDLKITNLAAYEGQLQMESLQLKGPHVRYNDNKLELSVSPEQFSDIENPRELQFGLFINPLSIDSTALTQAIHDIDKSKAQ